MTMSGANLPGKQSERRGRLVIVEAQCYCLGTWLFITVLVDQSASAPYLALVQAVLNGPIALLALLQRRWTETKDDWRRPWALRTLACVPFMGLPFLLFGVSPKAWLCLGAILGLNMALTWTTVLTRNIVAGPFRSDQRNAAAFYASIAMSRIAGLSFTGLHVGRFQPFARLVVSALCLVATAILDEKVGRISSKSSVGSAGSSGHGKYRVTGPAIYMVTAFSSLGVSAAWGAIPSQISHITGCPANNELVLVALSSGQVLAGVAPFVVRESLLLRAPIPIWLAAVLTGLLAIAVCRSETECYLVAFAVGAAWGILVTSLSCAVSGGGSATVANDTQNWVAAYFGGFALGSTAWAYTLSVAGATSTCLAASVSLLIALSICRWLPSPGPTAA